jgi:hypothetical protein
MRSAIDFTDANYQKNKTTPFKNEEQYQPQKSYTIKWKLTKRCHSPFF